MLEDLRERYSEARERYSYLQDTGRQLLVVYTVLIGGSGLYGAGFVSLELMGFLTAAVLLVSYRTSFEEVDYSRNAVAGLLVAVTVAGLGLRIHSLGVQSMWFDESITSNAAKAVLDHSRPVFPSGMEYWRAFPHTLMAAASAKIFGFTDFALRLPSVLIGTATIPVTYLAGKEMFDTETGLLAATLIAFATWEIAWSRQARMYPLLQLAYLGAVLLTHRVSREFSYRDAGLLAASFVTATLTHPIGYILPPAAALYIAIDRYQYTSGLENYLRSSLKPLSALIAAAAVVSLLEQSYLSVVRRTLSVNIDHLSLYHDWVKDQLSALYLLAVTGAVIPFTTEKRRQGILVVLALAPAAYILAFHVQLAASRYLYFAVPFLAILGSQTLKTVATYVHQATGIHRTALVAIAVAGLLFSTASFTTEPQTQYQLGINAPQPDFKSAYSYVENNSEGNETLVAGWTAPALRYYKAPDYWPQFSLTGTGGSWSINGTERYSGAKVLTNQRQLEQVVQQNPRGWIILDSRAYSRQPPGTQNLVRNQTLAYESREIKVWKWERQILEPPAQ
jgi:hypothetical protein